MSLQELVMYGRKISPPMALQVEIIISELQPHAKVPFILAIVVFRSVVFLEVCFVSQPSALARSSSLQLFGLFKNKSKIFSTVRG